MCHITRIAVTSFTRVIFGNFFQAKRNIKTCEKSHVNRRRISMQIFNV